MIDAAMWKYFGVFSALILSGFGFPIPEEIPVVTAGAMVGHDAQAFAYHENWSGALGGGAVSYLDPIPTGVTRWWIMLPVMIIGVVLGDSVLYTAGRVWGRRILKIGWVQKRIIPIEKQEQIEANFNKNGILILLAARFTPGIRTPVFLMAGVLKMPLSRFLLADGLYAIPGVNLLFWLAYLFTDQFVEVIHNVERHKPLIAVVILAAVGGIVLYKLLVQRKLATGDMEDIPRYVKPVGAVTQAVEWTIEQAVTKTVQTLPKVVDKVTHPLGHGHAAATVSGGGLPTPIPTKDIPPEDEPRNDEKPFQ